MHRDASNSVRGRRESTEKISGQNSHTGKSSVAVPGCGEPPQFPGREVLRRLVTSATKILDGVARRGRRRHANCPAAAAAKNGSFSKMSGMNLILILLPTVEFVRPARPWRSRLSGITPPGFRDRIHSSLVGRRAIVVCRVSFAPVQGTEGNGCISDALPVSC